MRVAGGATGNAAELTQLSFVVSEQFWAVGGVFFGLWLIPLGVVVLRSRWMPRPLGVLLLAGGAGFVLSALTAQLVPGAGAVVVALTVPATVGEFWVIGHLLLRGVAPAPASPVPVVPGQHLVDAPRPA